MSYRFLSPRPGEEHELDQWDSRTLGKELESFESRTLVRIFDQHLANKRFRILEGGCGLGAWWDWFNRRGHDAVGIEYNEEVVKRAKEFRPDVAVELRDVTNLKFPDNSFDAYVSLGVIEHFEHGPERALAEACPVLKPGGLAFVSTPYSNVLRRLIVHPMRSLYFLIRKLRAKPGYFWEYRFRKKELKEHLEKSRCGFWQYLLVPGIALA